MKYYFYKWRDDGTDQTIHDLLRRQVRESRGRKADPSLVVSTPRACTRPPGCRPSPPEGARQKKSRAGLEVDVLGLVIAVVVLAASAHDNAADIALVDKVAADTDTVEKALVDQGLKTAVVGHGRKVGIDVEVVERNPATSGFVPQPIRWRVEQVNGILILHRRLVRDYEHRPASAESRVYWAVSDRLSRMLTATSTPTWRGA
nr:IS5/IS1182 family transposase [Streptomyces sp. SID486]